MKDNKLERDAISKKINDLLMDIDAMKSNPVLIKDYGKKIKELARLRRQMTRLGKKDQECTD